MTRFIPRYLYPSICFIYTFDEFLPVYLVCLIPAVLS